MPYVAYVFREIWAGLVDPLAAQIDERVDAGTLNYMVTRVVRAALGPRPDYERFNTLIGVLEAAKLELYRRMVAPYEDRKITEHGDVYQRPHQHGRECGIPGGCPQGDA
jgi:hypothetical protein